MSESGEQRNYRILLGHGAANGAGYELTSEKLVLPFLYTAVGAPVFFAGLLVPIAAVAKLAVQIVAAPMISAARSNKKFIALAAVATAMALVVISVTVNAVPVDWLVPVFLLVSMTIGAAGGFYSLAFNDMLGRVLPQSRRSRLLFTQSGLAGIFAVVVALGSQFILPPGTSLAAHQELLWLGIVLILISAGLVATVREPEKIRAPDQAAVEGRRRIAELGHGFRIAFALPWFKHFVIARALFLSVELAMPFFSIHAATFHGNTVTGLSTFVIASSAGLVVGGLVWPRIGARSIRLLLMLAAGVAAVGGVLALIIEFTPSLQSPEVYAIVFVLVGFGAQGILNGRTLYLVSVTRDIERPFCIASSSVITGVVAVGLGAVAGAFAQLQGVGWPIGIMIVLNIAAMIYTTKLRDIRPTPAATKVAPATLEPR
ncbi:MFS transporter [Bauldia litoralis]|uniref:MFS transporter n=1 Tax=Bauldia litoralis TaxID=665467 RepID=UPI0032679C07